MRFKHFGPVWLASMVGAGCASPANPPSLDSALTVTVSTPTGIGGTSPVSGAAVAVDTADGARHEATTESDGTATFSGLDLVRGPFSFTVAAPGYVAVSDVGLSQPGGWNVTLPPFGADPTWIDVSGVVRGRQDPDHFVHVSASISSTSYEGLGPQYALRIAPDLAFALVVAELTYGSATGSTEGRTALFTAWARFTHPGVADVSNLDLAMPGAASSGGAVGESLMPSTAQGTLIVSPRMVGARGSVNVSNAGSLGSMFLGAATRMTLDPNGRDLDYEVAWVSPVSDLVTTYALSLGGASSYARSTIAPGGSISFLDPPSVTSSLSISADIVVNNVVASAELSLNVVRDAQSTGWRVFQHGSSGGTVHIPKLPSAIDPRLVLGTGGVTVVPEVCAPGSDGFCAQYAAGAPGTLVMP